jgi:hypothetical protein
VKADIVDGDHVRMVERAAEPGLLLEASDELRISGEWLVHYLEGDVASESSVRRPITSAMPPEPRAATTF